MDEGRTGAADGTAGLGPDELGPLFAACPTGLFVLDRHGDCLFANPRAEAILGVPRAEVAARLASRAACHPLGPAEGEASAAPLPWLVAARTGRPSPSVRLFYRQPDGRRRILLASAAPLPLAAARGPAVVVSLDDVTDRFDVEARAQATFRTSPDAISLNRLDDGVYVDVNEGYLALTGWGRAELIGRSSAEIGIWADPADRVRLVEGLQRRGAVSNLEARFRLRDGRYRSGLMSARIVLLGDVPHILAVTRDIEDWKQDRASRETLLRLVENSHDFISVATLDGQLTYLNRAGRELVGLAPQADVGALHISALIGTGDELALTEQTLATLRQRGRLRGEGRMRHLGGGAPIDVEYSAFVLPAGGPGDPPRVAVVARDVSERKRSLQLLASNEARSRRIVDNLVDVYVETSADGVVLEVSNSVERTFGYTREEAIGRLRPEQNYVDLEARAAIVRQVQAEGHADDFEVEIRHKDGRGIPCAMSTRATRDPLDGSLRFVSMIRDISDRKRAQAEKTRLQEQLREAQRLESIGRLAGGVAHDFNNLLTPILGFADLLRLTLPEGPTRDAVEQMRAAGVRGKDLTAQLLAFGRRQVLQVRDVDLNELLRQVQPMLARLVRENLALVLELAPEPLGVSVDPSHVDQVLVNLTMNAQDAMPHGGALTIRTAAVLVEADDPRHPGVPAGRWAHLAVTDQGHGMDPETLGRVFEPFFTTKRAGRGTGLGLATSYGIVKQHGGQLVATSELGRGSTFAVYLPLVATLAPLTVAAADEPVGAPRGGETLLLVEDEPAVLELACSVLQSHGYRVLQAGDAERAEQLAASHPDRIDLLLSDVILPGANGRQLYLRLRDQRPGLRVLYMSGYPDEVIARHGILEADVRLIQKPFSVLELTSQVRQALDESAPPSPRPAAEPALDGPTVRGGR